MLKNAMVKQHQKIIVTYRDSYLDARPQKVTNMSLISWILKTSVVRIKMEITYSI